MDIVERLRSRDWHSVAAADVSVDLAVELASQGDWHTATRVQILMVNAGLTTDDDFVAQVQPALDEYDRRREP